MGMGKTIQAVSLIMSDWPAKKPSLVLMPPVALLQWQHEINAYTDGALKTFVYHGTNAKSKGISKQDIMKFDVILMSYNSLESIYRKQEKGFKRKDGTFKEKSVIHQTRFHRVILDEAHCIKVCSELLHEYRKTTAHEFFTPSLDLQDLPRHVLPCRQITNGVSLVLHYRIALANFSPWSVSLISGHIFATFVNNVLAPLLIGIWTRRINAGLVNIMVCNTYPFSTLRS